MNRTDSNYSAGDDNHDNDDDKGDNDHNDDNDDKVGGYLLGGGVNWLGSYNKYSVFTLLPPQYLYGIFF